MPVPSQITDLSDTAAVNSPAGSEAPTEGDNHLRTAYAFIRQLYDVKASTADLGTVGTITAGDAMIAVKSTLTGGAARTQHQKNAERVSVADFLTTETPTATQTVTAIQAAIDSGAKRIYISRAYTVNAPVTLAANQIVDFDGGSITATVGISAPNGILYGNAKANVRILDPVIDASATTGVTGIKLKDCTNGTVLDGLLTKCCLLLDATSNSTRMNYKVRGTVVDMDGWQSTAVLVSRVYKASLIDVECYDGIEGIGIYNACRHVKHSHCESWGHTRDGFVIIDGQRITYSDCISHDNTQSGFTTQRLAAGTDCQYVSYTGCHAYENTADGFDIRGASSSSWGVDMHVTCSSCVAYNNGATGFYVVLAEGTTIEGCVSANNDQQGYLVSESEGTILTGCRSTSNATGVASGTSNAGILIQASPNCGIVGCISGNSNGATQEHGISFTGASSGCYLTGGNYLNNSVLPFRQDTPLAYVSGAALQDVANVYIDSITGPTGVYSETGLGVPSHTRPKSSLFRRLDAGGSGEAYISSGGGTWTLL
jgi:hypothetical protein